MEIFRGCKQSCQYRWNSHRLEIWILSCRVCKRWRKYVTQNQLGLRSATVDSSPIRNCNNCRWRYHGNSTRDFNRTATGLGSLLCAADDCCSGHIAGGKNVSQEYYEESCDTLKIAIAMGGSIQRNFVHGLSGPTKAKRFSWFVMKSSDKKYWLGKIFFFFHMKTEVKEMTTGDYAIIKYIDATPSRGAGGETQDRISLH